MKIHNLWWKYNIFLYSFKAFERFLGEKFTKKKYFYYTFDKKHIIISEWKERHVKHKKLEACKGMRECLTDKEQKTWVFSKYTVSQIINIFLKSTCNTFKKITCITQQIFFASDETIATCDMLNPYLQETNLQTIFTIKKELGTNNGKKKNNIK